MDGEWTTLNNLQFAAAVNGNRQPIMDGQLTASRVGDTVAVSRSVH